MIDRVTAESGIKALFASYGHKLNSTDSSVLKALSDGKLYELFVLSKLVRELSRRHCLLQFHGGNIKFKANPGKIKSTDPHFTVQMPNGQMLWMFVNIEFKTLGCKGSAASDNSFHHELDIVVVDVNDGYPTFEQIWLAVECKAVANFQKGLLKEVLGVRRELSYISPQQPSRLSAAGASPAVGLRAHPASEFWFAFIDPKGLNYKESPKAFEIEFRHIAP